MQGQDQELCGYFGSQISVNMSCHVVSPTDIPMIEIPNEDQGLQVCGCS